MTPEAIKSMCKAIALTVLATGVFGSLLVVPFAIGWDFQLIAISGVYFIAGAVMITGGLFTYTYISLQK